MTCPKISLVSIVACHCKPGVSHLPSDSRRRNSNPPMSRNIGETGGAKLALTPDSRISLYFSGNARISELYLEMCREFAEVSPPSNEEIKADVPWAQATSEVALSYSFGGRCFGRLRFDYNYPRCSGVLPFLGKSMSTASLGVWPSAISFWISCLFLALLASSSIR